MKDSVVHASVRIARRAVFVVLVTAAIVIGLLIIERNLLELTTLRQLAWKAKERGLPVVALRG